MPYVTISLKEGRTIEQKRALAKAVTEAVVRTLNSKPDAVHIVLHDEPAANFAREGILLADRTQGGGRSKWGMAVGTLRFEAQVAPDGRVIALCAVDATGPRRAIEPASAEAVAVLSAGRDIRYRFDEERALQNLPYPDLLTAMQQEVALTLHKARHGELLDEPELIPGLRKLLRDLEETARAFAAAREGLDARP